MKQLARIHLMAGIIFMVLTSFCSCSKYREIEYFSQKENYINAEGTVTHFKYSDRYNAWYLGFSDVVLNGAVVPDEQTLDEESVADVTWFFDNSTFKIIGEDFEIVQANKIGKKIKLGDRVEFASAPGWFGDGYVLPIVAISINGESLLDFEEGYENFLDWLSD